MPTPRVLLCQAALERKKREEEEDFQSGDNLEKRQVDCYLPMQFPVLVLRSCPRVTFAMPGTAMAYLYADGVICLCAGYAMAIADRERVAICLYNALAMCCLSGGGDGCDLLHD